MIRFLHTADLHLGMRITRFEKIACDRLGESRFFAIEQLRAAAVEHQVDFVLVAGDLFDDHSVSQEVSRRAFDLFEGRAIPPVYIIPGNHDPLTPGGVWDRDPWTREQPSEHTHLLREAVPVRIPGLPVTLFPCPCRSRNSPDDPTSWIANHPRKPVEDTIRIGLAHGSLKIMPNLPEDDHLIAMDAAARLSLDYLALGHWHKPLRVRSTDGVERTAYCGTHEPMRFPGSATGSSSGWMSYSSDGDAERFEDEGRGTAVIVTLSEPGAAPELQSIEVGRLCWMNESRDLTSCTLGEVISSTAQRENPERTVLRLNLRGVTDPHSYVRIDGELRTIVLNRFHAGTSLDSENVLIEPSPDELTRTVGDGVLAKVLERLRQESQSTDAAEKRVADHALKLLYRLAWENQSP